MRHKKKYKGKFKKKTFTYYYDGTFYKRFKRSDEVFYTRADMFRYYF